MSRHIRTMTKCSLLCLIVLVACDPEKEALKLFTDQGLTVLKPARDYIALGGLFVVPNSGTTVYLDPYDTLPPSNGTATPFRAVVLQESKNQNIAFDAAVGTLGGLVPIPAGLKFSHSAQVQLAQIDASGTRYTTQMIAALIKRPDTIRAIQAHLQPGNRVFIVQELYTSKSLSLKSSTSNGLAGAVEGSANIPTCSSTSSGGNTGASKKGGASTGGSTTGGGSTGGSTTGGSTTGGSTTGATTTGSANTGSSTGDTANGSGKTGTSKATASNAGITVGLCWSNAATLSFKSDTAIPFAVRLNEVIAGPGNELIVKDTNFKLPNKALGAGDVSATALINPQDPTVRDFTHVPH